MEPPPGSSVDTKGIAALVEARIEIQNLNLEDVAGLGFVNVNWLSEDVNAVTCRSSRAQRTFVRCARAYQGRAYYE